jgi:hypothetical protein
MPLNKLSVVVMFRGLWLTLFATIAMLSPAHAARLVAIDHRWIWIQFDDGSIVGYNKLFVLFLVVAIIGLIVACAMSAAQERARQAYTTPSYDTQYYEREANRIRAIKRQLDEEAAYFEHLTRVMRAHDEADELPEIIQHEKAERDLQRKLNNG